MALLAAMSWLFPVPARASAPTLTSAVYVAPNGLAPATITITGTGFTDQPTVSLGLNSPTSSGNQTLFAIDPAAVKVLSSTSVRVTIPQSFFSNYSYFRDNGITQLRPGQYFLQATSADGSGSNVQVVNVPLLEFQPPSPSG